jgi:hypothetical protein
MPIELATETLIPLSGAARRLPSFRSGKPVSFSCLYRWVCHGVRLPSGEWLRLEAVRLGGRWLTSVEALQRFVDRQTPSLDTSPEALRPPATNRRDSERVERELDGLGI